MAHLKVINFGAIKSADIEIKKYNFFSHGYLFVNYYVLKKHKIQNNKLL